MFTRKIKSRPLSNSGKCPAGYHKRKSYSLNGQKVRATCVKSTTVYKNSSKEFKNREKERMSHRLKLYIPSMKSLARKACPPGQIERKPFVRRYSSKVRQEGFTVHRNGKTYKVFPKEKSMYVEPTCVPDKGKPGTGIPVSIGPLRKGELSKYGYSFRKSEGARHTALKSAVNEYGALGVFRKLDAVAKLTKTTIPEASKVYTEDRAWIQSKFGPLKAPA